MKIYLEDNREIEYYRNLGIPIHRGPRGGIFIESEDLKNIGKKRLEGFTHLGEKELVREMKNLFSVFKEDIQKVYKKDGAVFIAFDNESGIYFDKEEVGVFRMDKKVWHAKNDDPLAMKILTAAMVAVKDDKLVDISKKAQEVTEGLFDCTYKGKKESYGTRLIAALTYVSVATGLSVGNDFGPWISENVLKFEEKDAKYLKDKKTWQHLGRIISLAYGKGFNQNLKINFVSSEKLREKVNSKSAEGAYFGIDHTIWYIGNDCDMKINPIWILWHEFGHHMIGEFYGPMYDWAMKIWNHADELTPYAKVSPKEAFCEFIGKCATDEAYRKKYKIVLDDIESVINTAWRY